MAAPTVRSDFDALTKLERVFAQNASSVRKTRGRLKSQVDVLQGGAWKGKGANAFYQEMNSGVLPSIDHLASALEGAQQATSKANQHMKATEEEVAKIFKQYEVSGTPMKGVGAPGAAGGAAPGAGSGPPTVARAITAAAKSKAQAKKAAAHGATAMNDAAAILGGTAVVATVIGAASAPTIVGAGVAWGIAGACGLGSAAAWYMGNRYGELANDPPRDDFQIETRYAMHDFHFQTPENEFEAAWQDLSRLLVSQSEAVKSLVTSLERYDGLTASMKATDEVSDGDTEHIRFAILQADAIAHNARAAAELAEQVLELEPRANLAWAQLQEALTSAKPDLAKLSSAELTTRFSELWQENKPSFQQGLQFSDSQMEELAAVAQANMHGRPLDVEPADVLFNQDWTNAIQQASVDLRQLSDSFGLLKSAMESQKNAS